MRKGQAKKAQDQLSGGQISSDEALNLMIHGNARFAAGVRSVESFVGSLRLRDLAERGQKPFCAILTCSDSRAPTETIFDRGLGDMFVMRVAGNVLSP
ncbi:MAG: carbonic anhydrase, partial [Proteobacteria bacterium]|nr:carbonic anhydrase [Pseudomonadota bacterium]